MFKIDGTTIHLTRGDTATLSISATEECGKSFHTFKAGDILRLNVTKKGNESQVLVSIEKEVTEDSLSVDITISSEQSKIGNIINSPIEYWYEIEYQSGDTYQTIVGYDDEGPKIFKVYPESVKGVE